MARKTKLPTAVLNLVMGVALRARLESEKESIPTRQPSIEQRMSRIAASGGSKGDDRAVHEWLRLYSRTTRYDQLSEWGLLEKRARRVPGVEFGALDTRAGETGADETFRIERHFESGRVGRYRWKPWNELNRDERFAAIAFLLEQDQLGREYKLRRLGVVGIRQFLNEVSSGTYDGEGYTPYEEMALLGQGHSLGLIKGEWSDLSQIAKRVSVGMSLRPRPTIVLMFENGAPASRVLGRAHALRR